MVERRIGIVGAGPAGLSTAMYLHDAGYRDVTVLEARDRIGGKCHSLSLDGDVFDLGANYLTPAYRETLRIARNVGANTHAAPSRRSVDLTTGNYRSTLASVVSGVGVLSFGLAAARYLTWLWRYRDLVRTPGFRGIGAIPDLHRSLGAWLDAHGMTALRRLFIVPIEIFGYGYVDEVPAPYVFKYMHASNFLLMLAVGAGLPVGWPKQFDQGFQDLWERIAAAWQLEVRTGVAISSIRRGDDVVVTLEDGQELAFDDLVIACPPAPVVDRFDDAAPWERELFGQVRTRRYWVTATSTTGMPHHLIDEIQRQPAPPLPRVGHPWGISKMHRRNPAVLFYSTIEGEVDDGEVDRLIDQDILVMGGTAGERIARQKWDDYFPHLEAGALAQGWYERVEDRQGERGIWFAGGLMAFETVEPILAYSKELVARMQASWGSVA